MTKGLFKRWEKLPMVRARIRKSKPWLKLKLHPEDPSKPGKNKDIIVDTQALKDNSYVLQETLNHYGLVLQPIPDMTDQALLCLKMLLLMLFGKMSLLPSPKLQSLEGHGSNDFTVLQLYTIL